jgi:SNF2 family DNA or RNA helicase
MSPLNDSSEVTREIHRLHRADSINEWKYIFNKENTSAIDSQDPTASPPLPNFPAEIRLRFSIPRLIWEARDTPDSPWRGTQLGEAKSWFAAFNDGVLPLTPASPLFVLFSQITALYYHDRHVHGSSTDIQTVRFEDRRAQRLVRWLLLTPAMQSLLVAEGGTPFRQPPAVLKWTAAPDPDDSSDVLFRLVADDGAPVPLKDLTFFDKLDNPPYLALLGDTPYLRPRDLPGHTLHLGAAAPAIPLEALATPAASLWMKKNAVDTSALQLPEFRTVPLLLAYEVRLTNKETGAPDRIHLKLLARDSTRSHVRAYEDGKWTLTTRKHPNEDDAFTDFRMPDSTAAEIHLQKLDFFWEPYSTAYVRRFTQPLLEDLAAWFKRAHALGIELDLEPVLEALGRAPDTASLEIDFAQGKDDGASGIDWFDLKVALKPSDADLTQEELNLLLRANGSFVNLPGKGFRRLKVFMDKERCASLIELGIEPDALTATAEHHRLHTLQLADERIAGILPEEYVERIRERAARLHTLERPPIPSGLSASLRPYQVEGFHFLAHLSANSLGGILADDMGLGKTVQTLAWLLWLGENKKLELRAKNGNTGSSSADTGTAVPLRALVVCPKSVVPNWSIETARFAPSLTTATLNLDSPDPAALLPVGVNITVVNYAQLRNNTEALTARPWDAVILDEGQNIKTPSSQTAKAARDLPARNRVILTGTPIENRLLDLWSLFSFSMPGLLGTQASFKRLYNDKESAAFASSRLAARTRHFMLRRTKTQVAPDLPPRIEEDLLVELDGPQRQLYDAEVKRARLALLNIKTARQFDLARFNILQSLLRLRQICCHPALIGFKESGATPPAGGAPALPDTAATAEPVPKRRGRPRKNAVSASAPAPDSGSALSAGTSPSAKLEALLEQIEPIVEEGHRILVFSQFVSMLELIRVELQQRGIKHLMLTGKTENRQELVNTFQSSKGPPVFLLSLKAAGSGLNLTAASYVFLFDPWWNPAVEAQAIDRTHRIGQKSRVIAYRLLAKDTVEEKIRQLQHRKASLAKDVVQEESLSTVLNLDDIRFVLG